MNEQKLDLILTVVSELKGKVDKFDLRLDGFEGKLDKLDSRIESLENGFRDFKKQFINAFEAIKTRIYILEKQRFAIGVELKDDLRRETNDVQQDINNLENKIMLEQAEKLQDRVRVRELEMRLSRLEEKFRLAA